MNSLSLLPEDDEEVKLYFVVPLDLEEQSCDADMKEAHEKSLQSDLEPSWTSEEHCLTLKPTKRDVFVLQQFSGPAFDYLKDFKCVITGPRCLSHCIMMNAQMPLVPYPTFTAAMKDLFITCSGGGVEVKKEIKEKVELMAGTYLKNFTHKTTHVVVSSVRSSKYEKAMELGIPVRTCEWIHAVWKRSCKEYCLATDSNFDKFKCPPFLDLRVCTTGLSLKEMERVKNAVINNGGTFDTSLTQSINVLVVRNRKSPKFTYAKSWSIPCVEPRWIYDSVQNGHALPTKSYEVISRAASSPTSGNDSMVSFAVNISNICPDQQRTHIDETLMSASTCSVGSYRPSVNPSTPVKMPPPPVPKWSPAKTPIKKSVGTTPNPGELKHILKDLRIDEIKAAGSFLDGCGVYLTGWTPEEEESLKKILKCSGAARFSDLSDRVSHVLVGDLQKPFLRSVKALSHKPHIVNVKWLIQSVEEKSPAAEEPFYCLPSDNMNSSEAPSPLSKKGMALLQRENISPQKPSSLLKCSVPEFKNGSPAKENQLLAKYISSETSGKETMSSSAEEMPPPPAPSLKSKRDHIADSGFHLDEISTPSSQNEEGIFSGLKFVIVGLDEHARKYVIDLVCKYDGEVVTKTFKGIPDYAVVPLTGVTLHEAATEIVTVLWLESCEEQKDIVPVSYYHQPVVFDENKKPLDGCVVGLSGFNGKERQFIVELATVLGAVCQDVFAKKTKSNAKASSHLICKTSDKTEKFNAAIKWCRPAVYYSWLLACADSATLVPEEKYLVDPKQVIKALEVTNLTSASANDASPMSSKCEVPHIASLKERFDPKTPERTKPSYDQAHVDRILNYVPTPDPHKTAPIGLSDNPTPNESRRLERWLERLPEKLPSPPPRRDSTPFHELRRRVIEAHTVTTPELLRLVPMKPGGIDREDIPVSANAMKKEMKGMSSEFEFSEGNPEEGSSTSTGSGVPFRKLFEGEEEEKDTLFDGPLDKLNKLIATPEVEVEKASPSIKIPSVNNHKFVGNLEGKKNMYDTLKDGSQPYAIKWEDPVNWKKNLKDGSSSSTKSDHEDEEKSSGKRKSSEAAENSPDAKRTLIEAPQSPPKEPVKKEYKFSFSSVGEKEHYLSIITKLGGVLKDSSSYNPEATHLIVEKCPQRSEKLLAFIASGKWVLHVSFLLESEKSGKFVEEEKFEWGNPCNSLVKRLKEKSVELALAKAVYRWRTSVTSGKSCGAFEGFNCKIYTSDDKTVAFSRLISAGGGKVLPIESSDEPSFCLLNLNTHKDILIEYAKKGIPCLPLTFLYEHLTVDPSPDPKFRALDEYKKLRQKYSS